MRRGILSTGLILLLSLAWTAPAAAQAGPGWTVQVEGRAGYFLATRDLGKILGAEVQAQIKSTLQPAPLYGLGFIVSGPSAAYSLRGSVGYMSTDAEGQALGCDSGTIYGAGCTTLDIGTTALQGTLDILLHNDTGSGLLKYFVAGLGIRQYTFDEPECRGITNPNVFAVCSPMTEFLADQKGLVGRIGGGVRGRGPVGWSIEILDQVGKFQGSGERGESGIQNDIIISGAIVFPGR